MPANYKGQLLPKGQGARRWWDLPAGQGDPSHKVSKAGPVIAASFKLVSKSSGKVTEMRQVQHYLCSLGNNTGNSNSKIYMVSFVTHRFVKFGVQIYGREKKAFLLIALFFCFHHNLSELKHVKIVVCSSSLDQKRVEN